MLHPLRRHARDLESRHGAPQAAAATRGWAHATTSTAGVCGQAQHKLRRRGGRPPCCFAGPSGAAREAACFDTVLSERLTTVALPARPPLPRMACCAPALAPSPHHTRPVLQEAASPIKEALDKLLIAGGSVLHVAASCEHACRVSMLAIIGLLGLPCCACAVIRSAHDCAIPACGFTLLRMRVLTPQTFSLCWQSWGGW